MIKITLLLFLILNGKLIFSYPFSDMGFQDYPNLPYIEFEPTLDYYDGDDFHDGFFNSKLPEYSQTYGKTTSTQSYIKDRNVRQTQMLGTTATYESSITTNPLPICRKLQKRKDKSDQQFGLMFSIKHLTTIETKVVFNYQQHNQPQQPTTYNSSSSSITLSTTSIQSMRIQF
ncbi:hypothetical protein ACTFIR_009797 [Dictyostelium discoideum]